MTRHVIVGAGQAGLQVVEALRRDGYQDELVLVGAEAWLPYQRPPLSKKFLQGETTAERLLFRPQDFYAKQHVDTHLGVTATGLDTAAHRLSLSDGTTLDYDGLVLCTGARVRTLTMPGADDPRVCYLRGLDDAARLKTRLEKAERVVILGAGFIGLEVAAIARKAGRAVTVVEAQSRVLQRVVAPTVSAFFEALHRGHGVDLRLDARLARLESTPEALKVMLADGSMLAADLLLVGIGVEPEVDLAKAAGIHCEGGILVDEFARTSAPDVLAAGDCTCHRNLLYPAPHRVESVQNAVDQGKVAAATLLGKPEAYAAVPWFWSDQYEVKLQMVGLSGGHDSLVIRGVPEAGAFSVFYRAGDHVIAVDSINRPAEHMVARKLIAAGGRCNPDRLADTAVDLKSILDS